MPVPYGGIHGIGSTIQALINGFHYDYSLQTKNKSKDGLTMSSGFVYEKGETNVICGSSNLEYKDDSFGEVEVNMKVNGKDEEKLTKLSVTFDQLYDGLTLSASCNAKPEVKLLAKYSKDAIAAEAALATDHTFEDAQISANAAYTMKQFTVGLSGKYEANKPDNFDSDAALQFDQSPHIVSIATRNKFNSLLLGYHVSPRDDLAVGAQLEVKELMTKPDWVSTFGVDFQIDATTSLKAKIDTDKTISFKALYQLSNPPLKLSLCNEMKPFSGDLSATAWGFGITLGDY